MFDEHKAFFLINKYGNKFMKSDKKNKIFFPMKSTEIIGDPGNTKGIYL